MHKIQLGLSSYVQSEIFGSFIYFFFIILGFFLSVFFSFFFFTAAVSLFYAKARAEIHLTKQLGPPKIPIFFLLFFGGEFEILLKKKNENFTGLPTEYSFYYQTRGNQSRALYFFFPPPPSKLFI